MGRSVAASVPAQARRWMQGGLWRRRRPERGHEPDAGQQAGRSGRLLLGAPGFRVGLGAAVAVALIATAVPNVASAARQARVRAAVASGLAVASALETYRIEYGAFPAPDGAAAGLAAELGALLPAPVFAAAGRPFAYAPAGDGYHLNYTPDGSRVAVTLAVVAGQGGRLWIGGHSFAVGW